MRGLQIDPIHTGQLAMKRGFLVIAWATLLSGCASVMPDWLSTQSISTADTVALRLESRPPGAEARTTSGQGCRTPCVVTVVPSDDIDVTFSLAGYQPQTVPVQLVIPGGPGTASFSPNPVLAALEPSGPAPAAKKKPAAKPKAKAAARPAPAPSASAPAAAPASQPGMIPGSVPTSPPPGSPWPPPQR
jgi:hypothetical protein